MLVGWRRYDGEGNLMWRDVKKRSIGQNVVRGGSSLRWAERGRGLRDCGRCVAKGDNSGGAGDELALVWIPIGSNCHESIMECLAGDEFDLGADATVASLPALPSPHFRLSRWKGGDGFFFF
ncbi:hypothetical protein BHE74_00030578 [Ensete ventricosum]|nr:hypothetical protein BHE74_00030578 [Ensete ventricosum]